MTIAERDSCPGTESRWEVTVGIWESTDLPEGWRAEIIEGGLFLTGLTDQVHAHIVSLIQKELFRESFREESALSGSTFHQFVDVREPGVEALFVPDLVVLPGRLIHRHPEHFAGEAQLVVEVTSESTAGKDRGPKLHGYARAEVPLYLLVDRCDPDTQQGEATLYSDPRKGAYTSHTKVPFGKEIHLPEPFDLRIDTSAFQL
ncbi:Uma2 family endonuclease [Nocardiopsis sp. HNM0947]|uniref:Uma2 family endonuclease n=1 Tax=Nocardiopsis coralli TaxID=2772213 RepID=A0ABR9P5Y1_9ACTN|nr:Uma2 family endonuclease [Nocardiopsis coralli]MBE2999258.1 Uma2 family endonuclease [Nocardiopsis coralli]